MVLRTPRYVARRAGSQMGVLLTATLTAVAVATLLVLAVALPPRIAETTYGHTLAEEPAKHVIRASTAFDAESWVAADQGVRGDVEVSGLPFTISTTTWISGVTTPDLPERTNLVIGAMSDTEDRAELVDGRWPEPGQATPEVVVHEAALEDTGAKIGGELALTTSTNDDTQATTIVGTYRPTDPDGTAWREFGHGVIPGDSQQVTLLGPVLATPGDFADKLGLASGTATWTLRLDVARLSFPDADDSMSATAGLQSAIADSAGESFSVISSVDQHLERAHVAATSARAVLLGAVAMLIVLATWALTFTARLVAARRSTATALLRARGISPSSLTRWSALGALPFVAFVIVAAPVLATLSISWLTGAGAVDDVGEAPLASIGSWTAAVVAGLGWLALLVAIDTSMGRSMASVAMEHSRPPRRAALQRAGVDIVMVALAALGLQQLRRPAGDTPDLVLMLAPAAIVLAGALMLVRGLPWLGRFASMLTTRLRGFSPSLGTLDLARRPLRHSAAAVLLVLALAVSIVTSATNSTWHDFQGDVVDVAEPADVRVSTTTTAHPGTTRDELGQADGVEAVAEVARFVDHSQDIEADVIAVDPGDAKNVLLTSEGADAVDAVADDGARLGVITTSYAEHFGYSAGDVFQLAVGGESMDFEVSQVVAMVPGAVNEYAVLINRNAPELADVDTNPSLEEHENPPNCLLLRQTGINVPPGLEERCEGRQLRAAMWPDEWWIDSADGGIPAGTADIDGVVAVNSHAQAVSEAEREPATAGVLDALTGALGFTAIFLFIGSTVQAVSSYRARADEHAQLRAMGFTSRGTLTATAVEHLLLLGFAAVAGVGLGAFVAWLTVPHTVGGLAGLPPAPPLRFSLPWTVAGALTLALAVLLVVVVVMASAGLRRVNIVGVLREGGE